MDEKLPPWTAICEQSQDRYAFMKEKLKA
jgi:hypothetical protein